MIDKICSNFYRDSEGVSVLQETEEFAIIEEERIGKKYKVTEEYLDTDRLLSDNPKLKIYEDRGFKFGDYFEVLFNFESMLYYSPEDFEMYIFDIGDVEVHVNHPTLLFDLAMKGFGNDKYYESSSYWTISLQGITEDNYEEYLAKALFLIGYYNQSTNDDRYPECFEFLGEYYYKYAADEDVLEERRNACDEFELKKFKDLKYYEALAFYNEGMRLHGHEIAFQYFYKVLEHFFLVCRQDEFKNYIAEYNSNNNINKFIDAVTSVYKQGEDIQLKTLLVSVENEILPLINQAFTDGVILECTVEKFSDELYLYRNTIVHGKSDERFSVKIPSYIGAADEKFWTGLLIK